MHSFAKRDKPKVVLDTNIIVSALIAKHGAPAVIFEKLILGEIKNHISKEIVDEIKDVFQRREITKRTPKNSRDFIIVQLIKNSVFVKPRKKVYICEDKDDNKFLEVALEAKANFIVSGDKHLLKIKKYKKIKVLNPSEFVLIFK